MHPSHVPGKFPHGCLLLWSEQQGTECEECPKLGNKSMRPCAPRGPGFANRGDVLTGEAVLQGNCQQRMGPSLKLTFHVLWLDFALNVWFPCTLFSLLKHTTSLWPRSINPLYKKFTAEKTLGQLITLFLYPSTVPLLFSA